MKRQFKVGNTKYQVSDNINYYSNREGNPKYDVSYFSEHYNGWVRCGSGDTIKGIKEGLEEALYWETVGGY